MVEQKKPEVHDASIPPRLDFGEYGGLLFSFLWFHRGILLAAACLFGLYTVLTMAKDKVAENKLRDRQAPAFVYVPPPVDPMQPAGVDPSPAQPSFAKIPVETTPLVSRPVKEKSPRAENPEVVRFRNFVATADAESLLQTSTSLMEDVPTLDPADGVRNIARRQEISKRLRTMELTERQQEMAIIAELESLSQLDAINVQHSMELPDIRGQLLQYATELLNHPKVSISSKAHLAILTVHAVDLLIKPTRETLGLLTDVYQAHIDYTLLGGKEAVVIASVLQQIVLKHRFDEVVALRRDMVDRVLQNEYPGFEKLALNLKESVIFEDLEPASLATRIDGVSESVYEDVDLFYERLEQLPEASVAFYRIAVAVIDKHLQDEEVDRAARLLGWLQRMLPRIPDPETKSWVGENVAQYAEKIQSAQAVQ